MMGKGLRSNKSDSYTRRLGFTLGQLINVKLGMNHVCLRLLQVMGTTTARSKVVPVYNCSMCVLVYVDDTLDDKLHVFTMVGFTCFNIFSPSSFVCC